MGDTKGRKQKQKIEGQAKAKAKKQVDAKIQQVAAKRVVK